MSSSDLPVPHVYYSAKKSSARKNNRPYEQVVTDRLGRNSRVCAKVPEFSFAERGGSGFIAAHILELLLKQEHSVVTTVRSPEKADTIRNARPRVGKDKLDFAIVEDIACEGAFDEAVKSADPPFEAVIHTASPFTFNVTDVQKELLDPAVIGTVGILTSIKNYAPTVKRVVILSSFAANFDDSKGNRPGHTYSEKDWNPITHEEALQNPIKGYRASKTFAERAAWAFMSNETPTFTLTTLCPPAVFGPTLYPAKSLDAVNTSNQRIRNAIQGKWRDAVPSPAGVYLWVDVRDLALAHVRAMERPDAANKRFFVTAGYFSNKEIAECIMGNLLLGKCGDGHGLFPRDLSAGDYPMEGGLYAFDNRRSVEMLGVRYRSVEECVVDTVKSLREIAA